MISTINRGRSCGMCLLGVCELVAVGVADVVELLVS